MLRYLLLLLAFLLVAQASPVFVRDDNCTDLICPSDCDDASCYDSTLKPLWENDQTENTTLVESACHNYSGCIIDKCKGKKYSYDTYMTLTADCATYVLPTDEQKGSFRTYPKEETPVDAADESGESEESDDSCEVVDGPQGASIASVDEVGPAKSNGYKVVISAMALIAAFFL